MMASADTTPPALGPVTISPLGPAQYGTRLAGTTPVRGTGIGPWYVNKDGVTLTLSATDNVAVTKFQYALGADETVPFVDFPDLPRGGATATGSVVITKEGITPVRYRALDAAGNFSETRTVTIQIDTRPPEIAFPTIVNNRIARATVLKPAVSDPAPGSGAVAIRSAELDGKFAYPQALDLAALSPGKHTWALTAADAAGNATRASITFVVGPELVQVSEFRCEPAKGPNQHPFVTPLPSASLAAGKPGARFKILVFSNRKEGFRHEHIQTTERVIGQLGKDNGFDVDLFDYVYPELSVSNPFASLDTLKGYKVIVGVSLVGNGQFSTSRALPDGTVADEQKVLQDYIHQGGGFVAIHSAVDSMHGWGWYGDLIGAEAAGWSKNVAGVQPQCSSCNLAEVVTEDSSHPATQPFEKTWPVRDELFNFRSAPRAKVHPLLTLTDATYAAAIGGSAGNQASNAVLGYGSDHPIAWCQNFEGGRVFVNALMHNWENSYDPRLQRSLLKGIEWAAGAIPGNCVTFREVKNQIAEAQRAGTIAQTPAASATRLVEIAYEKYVKKDYAGAISDIDSLRGLAAASSTGAAPARSALSGKAEELKSWMKQLARLP